MNKVGKILLFSLILLLAVSSASLFAIEEGSVNYFKPMENDEAYGALLDYVFNGGALDGVFDEYVKLEEAMSRASYEEWMKSAALGRAALICSRYANQCKNDDMATTFMKIADGYIAQSKEEGAPESATGVLEALSSSFWYLIEGKLSQGLNFTKRCDSLYEEYPQDFHVVLLKADRYLHSPGIAGGSKKKGLDLFQQAEKMMNQYGCAIWDRFTIYSGLAFGYEARNNDEKAEYYTRLAYGIYTADETVNELMEKFS